MQNDVLRIRMQVDLIRDCQGQIAKKLEALEQKFSAAVLLYQAGDETTSKAILASVEDEAALFSKSLSMAIRQPAAPSHAPEVTATRGYGS